MVMESLYAWRQADIAMIQNAQNEKAGKKAFCTCGTSSNQPYCDGSHKGSGFSPEIVELTEDKKVAWCGCKQSGNGAFCDGSHKKI